MDARAESLRDRGQIQRTFSGLAPRSRSQQPRSSFLELVREPINYLIPECDMDDDVADVLHELCQKIFEEQLAGWYTDKSTWPRNRSLDVFCHWSDYQHHSMLVDLCEEPLASRMRMWCASQLDGHTIYFWRITVRYEKRGLAVSEQSKQVRTVRMMRTLRKLGSESNFKRIRHEQRDFRH